MRRPLVRPAGSPTRRAVASVCSTAFLTLAVVSSLVAVSLPQGPVAAPSFQDLPPPAAMAAAFDAKPVGLGKQVPVALVPVPAWSGAVEELSGPYGVVVAYDGPGTYPTRVEGVTIGSDVAHGVEAVSSSVVPGRVMDGLLGVADVPGGWVAVCSWGVPSKDLDVVAARIAAALSVWHSGLVVLGGSSGK